MRKSSLTLNARRCFLWRAGYLETRPSGSGKGSWKRADDQSTGTGTVRFNHSRQPFWKRGNAPASYFMKPPALVWFSESAVTSPVTLPRLFTELRQEPPS